MNEIKSKDKNLKELLLNTKYTIHYYQREYMWQRKHIEELIDDLTSEFFESFTVGDPREKASKYGIYFMGSIVLTGRENYIIDGQQRLTSLTLLMIYLNNRLKKNGLKHESIEGMIYSESYGKSSFNLNIEERKDVMESLFNDKEFDISNSSESITNIYNRYNDIVEIFEECEIDNESLLNFCDWLLERVAFIEIVAPSEQDAYKIFVTMNDRGLSLTSTEMLKGYLLSEITDDKKREELNTLWKGKIFLLKKEDDKGDDIFIKNWLRAKYALTIRETKAGATNQDFDQIGVSFHKWVRDNKDKLNLNKSEDFENFIKEFAKFADIYLLIKKSENEFNEDLKYAYYNSKVMFTLQTQLMLAPICIEDNTEVEIEKLNLVSRFVDLFIFSRITNYKSVEYSTIKNYIFNVTKDIRNSDVLTLKDKLNSLYEKLNYNFDTTIPEFRLNAFTKKYIKNILARITSFIEENSGFTSHYQEYMNTNVKNPFEIEHIITDHFEWFANEYSDGEEFKRYRNCIGSLLLLRKSINASLNDSLYNYKISKYCSNEGNIYSESLGKNAYLNNPGFLRFKNKYNLNFKDYDKFGKNEIKERTQLVIQLMKLIWNNDNFKQNN